MPSRPERTANEGSGEHRSSAAKATPADPFVSCNSSFDSRPSGLAKAWARLIREPILLPWSAQSPGAAYTVTLREWSHQDTLHGAWPRAGALCGDAFREPGRGAAVAKKDAVRLPRTIKP